MVDNLYVVDNWQVELFLNIKEVHYIRINLLLFTRFPRLTSKISLSQCRWALVCLQKFHPTLTIGPIYFVSSTTMAGLQDWVFSPQSTSCATQGLFPHRYFVLSFPKFPTHCWVKKKKKKIATSQPRHYSQLQNSKIREPGDEASY